MGRISKMTSKMVDYSSRDSPYVSDEQCGVGYSTDLAETLRSLKEEIRSCKADNDQIIQSQEKQAELMLYLFRVCQTCNDKGHFGSVTDMWIYLMGLMAVDLLVDTVQIDLIQ